MSKLSLTDALRVRPGPVNLDDYDSHAKPGFKGSKRDAPAAMRDLGERAEGLQERLFAEAHAGGEGRALLLVLQGMDTSGKGGIVRHGVGMLDPQGIHLHSFKAPTKAELAHDFLWRVRQQVPEPGMIGIFDRSHYEDVLAARVHKLTRADVINRRYDAINRFEQQLVERGTTVVKCMLHISRKEQRRRLLARLDDPTKHWKFNPHDIDERARWDDYRAAYEIALERCSTDRAPWFVVPSDRKWYRNWAVTQLLVDHLADLDPQYPTGDFDVAEQRRRLKET
jgi:PPK2 family polyphosphate:nucleotide phosphotransferase